MFEHEITIHEFLLGYLKMLLRDIDEEQLDTQPFGGANTPRWILAHLAICTDYASKALGGERACPREWHAAYGPTSQPNAPDAPRPAKSELLDAIAKGHARVGELARKADPEKMKTLHTLEILKGTPIKTVGEFIAHLMTSHLAGHIGQLSYWRRSLGKEPLF